MERGPCRSTWALVTQHGTPIDGLPERAETASAATGVHEVLAKPFDVNDLIVRAARLMETSTAAIAA